MSASVVKEIPSGELISNSEREIFDIGVRIRSELSAGDHSFERASRRP